jgi:hypothetical protein
VDRVLLVRGKLQIADHGSEVQAKILVDSIDTNLTLDTAADEAGHAGAGGDYPPPVTSNWPAYVVAGEEPGLAADEVLAAPAVCPGHAAAETAVQTRLLRIEIRPLSGWQDTVRQALTLADGYSGPDRVSILLGNRCMDFPGRQTSACPQLLAAVAGLPGVLRVEIGD